MKKKNIHNEVPFLSKAMLKMPRLDSRSVQDLSVNEIFFASLGIEYHERMATQSEKAENGSALRSLSWPSGDVMQMKIILP